MPLLDDASIKDVEKSDPNLSPSLEEPKCPGQSDGLIF